MKGTWLTADQRAAVDHAVQKFGRPTMVIVCGSGFARIFDDLKHDCIPWQCESPSRVRGHDIRLLHIRREVGNLWCFTGRRHLYEGCKLRELLKPIEVAAHTGASGIFLTCAVGGLREEHSVGDLAMVEDHINLTGVDPVSTVDPGERSPDFLDLQGAYDAQWLEDWRNQLSKNNEPVHQGVLGAIHGPSYETPAEVRMMQGLGVDFAGMSVVPEVIWARYRKLRVACLAVISNAGAGLTTTPIEHQDVLSQVRRALDRRHEALLSGIDEMLASSASLTT